MSRKYNTKSVSANYAASAADEIIYVNSSAGPVAITLLAIVNLGVRKRYYITDIG